MRRRDLSGGKPRLALENDVFTRTEENIAAAREPREEERRSRRWCRDTIRKKKLPNAILGEQAGEEPIAGGVES